MLTQVDFVWPQFYDSATCGVATSGFNASIQAWSQRLDAGQKPKLMLAALSFEDGGGGGYVAPDNFTTIVDQVQSMDLTNFAGVTLWDAAYGLLDKEADGENYVEVAKAALES